MAKGDSDSACENLVGAGLDVILDVLLCPIHSLSSTSGSRLRSSGTDPKLRCFLGDLCLGLTVCSPLTTALLELVRTGMAAGLTWDDDGGEELGLLKLSLVCGVVVVVVVVVAVAVVAELCMSSRNRLSLASDLAFLGCKGVRVELILWSAAVLG